MQNIKILGELFDRKLLEIIKLFLTNKDAQYSLQEISKEAAVPIATTFRIVKKLLMTQIIKEIKIKHLKVYQCQENDTVTFLEGFLKEGKRIIENIAEDIGKLAGVEEVLLHGKEEEDKANILIIGSRVNANEVKRICAEYKSQYRFSANCLTLEREQYQQMSQMGLYQGRKKILYRP